MADDRHVDEEFITYVVKSIVDDPDAVEVDRSVDEMGVLLSVSVASEDMGNLIGRQGATAKALRTLLRIIGAKHNARVNLKILEPEERADGGAADNASNDADDASDEADEAPAKEEDAATSVDDVLDELEEE